MPTMFSRSVVAGRDVRACMTFKSEAYCISSNAAPFAINLLFHGARVGKRKSGKAPSEHWQLIVQ